MIVLLLFDDARCLSAALVDRVEDGVDHRRQPSATLTDQVDQPLFYFAGLK
jgi:hypothetical protein